LCVARDGLAKYVPRPPIEWIEGERLPQERDGLGFTTETPQDERLQVARAQVVGVAAQREVEVRECGVPIATRAVNLRHRVKRRGLPRMVPRSLRE
jgi:hypothetical protein